MYMNIWGIGFIILGLLILLNALFGFNVPIFRILLALLLLYAGVSLLINPPSSRVYATYTSMPSQQVVFSKRYFGNQKMADSYQITFGQGIIDLRTQEITDPSTIDVSVSFGSGRLKLNPSVPTMVTAQASFGKVEFPDKSSISFGNHIYKNYNGDGEPVLKVQAQVSFGNLEIEND